jgi:hypothetical protein
MVSYLFYRSKFEANLNPFEINLIQFENRIGRTAGPPVSAVPTASPRCLTPHQAADDWAPVASRPTCQPRLPRRADPTALHCRPFSPLGRAARARPRGCFSRPRVAGRHAPWAVASGRFSASALGFKCFLIVLNSRNCFKLHKFTETCRNVQKFRNKICGTPIEPLFIVGLTKLAFRH